MTQHQVFACTAELLEISRDIEQKAEQLIDQGQPFSGLALRIRAREIRRELTRINQIIRRAEHEPT